jgi:hypothetical protein
MVDQRQGAVFRRAFLVAGDHEADRAGLGRHLGGRGNHRRDRALHVDRAAPVEQRAAPLGQERSAGPALPRRDDIEMPGESEMARALRPPADREQVFDRTVGRLAGNRAVHREAQRREAGLEAVEHQPGCRGDAGAGDQRFGQRDGIGGLGHAAARHMG